MNGRWTTPGPHTVLEVRITELVRVRDFTLNKRVKCLLLDLRTSYFTEHTQSGRQRTRLHHYVPMFSGLFVVTRDLPRVPSVGVTRVLKEKTSCPHSCRGRSTQTPSGVLLGRAVSVPEGTCTSLPWGLYLGVQYRKYYSVTVDHGYFRGTEGGSSDTGKWTGNLM